MRKITSIVIHCSDSDLPEHDNIKTIKQWHLARGFDDIGYHFVIVKNGDIKLGRPIEEVGAHVRGHNANSIGVCLTGRNIFSKEQKDTLSLLCRALCQSHNLTKKDIYPHNYFDKHKTCPNFDLKKLVGSWSWEE